MSNAFANCSSLKYLNINNFNTSSVINMTNMFYGCSSLLSLNLKNFNTSSLILDNDNDMFTNCNKNLIYCIDDNKEYNFKSLLEPFIKDCNYICLKNNQRFFKLISFI